MSPVPPTADVVVVGSGSAGAAVAARLSEDPRVRVVLLEAGPQDTAVETHVPAAFAKLFRGRLDWNYDTVPQRELYGRTVFWPRGRVLGGSSSMNAMMWVPGFPADYDGWAETAGPSWSWEAVQPEFARARDAMRIERQRDPRETTGELLASAQAAGYRIDPAESAGDGGFVETRVTQQRGARWSTADGYLRPAADRPNLHVVTGVLATRVVIEGGRATGVEFVDDPRGASGPSGVSASGSRRVVAAREIVLAAGAINTPQLLQLSGIGPAAELAKHGIPVMVDSPEVGEGLRDHLVCAHIVEARGDTLFAAETPAQLALYLATRKGMLTSNVAEAYGFVAGPGGLPDVELIFAPVGFVDEGLSPAAAPGITLGPILLRPQSRGTVRLRSADPAARPVIDPRYLQDGDDLERMVAGMLEAERILRRPPLASRLTGRYLQPAGAERMPPRERAEHTIRSGAHTLYHPTSTARMGSDARSVVDPELRVRGVDGLTVADASVFPEIIRGHTHAPALVVGERAATLVAQRLRGTV